MTDNQPPAGDDQDSRLPDDHPFAELFSDEDPIVSRPAGPAPTPTPSEPSPVQPTQAQPTQAQPAQVQSVPVQSVPATTAAPPETRREARERAAAEAASVPSQAQIQGSDSTGPTATGPAATMPAASGHAAEAPANSVPATTVPATTVPTQHPPADQTLHFATAPIAASAAPAPTGIDPQGLVPPESVVLADTGPDRSDGAESVFNFSNQPSVDAGVGAGAGAGSGGSDGYGTPPRPRKQPKPGRRRRVMVRIIVTVVIVGLLGGAGTFLYSTFGSQIQALLGGPASTDYEGAGTGEVMFKIGDGDFGEAIASNLESDGVVKSADTFYSLLLKQNPQPVFQIGTYKLASKMSAKSALTALLDPSSKVDFNVTIPEGMVAADILSKLADTTGIPLADFDSAAADYSSFGLPTEAPRIEGYLFPATYAFEPGQTPHQILQTMVDRTFQSLDAAGVAPADRHRVLTLAALIQKEAGPIPGDFAKVSRVFTNRLDIGMLLQSDATVAYGSGQTHRVETTEAERGDPNLYNTYVNPGLPVGPISNPGDDAIAAALHPADGPWLYFVTWNLETGETIFSVTGEEHEAAVEQWQAWMKEHPEYE